jgi:hypothetical protein
MPSSFKVLRKRIASAIERIKTWMRAHGARVLVDNLADSLSAERLDKLQGELGVPLPDDLRVLWSIAAQASPGVPSSSRRPTGSTSAAAEAGLVLVLRDRYAQRMRDDSCTTRLAHRDLFVVPALTIGDQDRSA